MPVVRPVRSGISVVAGDGRAEKLLVARNSTWLYSPAGIVAPVPATITAPPRPAFCLRIVSVIIGVYRV